MKLSTSTTLALLLSLGISHSPVTLAAFNFNSGSTGALGALTCTTNFGEKIIDVGASGIMNYSSINIASGCIVKFTPTGNGLLHKSNPVRLLVSGDVVIEGEINLDGTHGITSPGYSVLGGVGGPGGYNGGNTGLLNSPATAGFGPGGGKGGEPLYCASNDLDSGGRLGQFSPLFTQLQAQPLVGGSGGGGGCTIAGSGSSSGGGGGGALLIAATGTITLNGKISALGGLPGSAGSTFYRGGNGSAGMVYLVANQITGTGQTSTTLTIVETENNTSAFTKTGTQYNIGLQRLALDLTQSPTLTIATVGGVDTSITSQVELGSPGDTVVTVTSTGLPTGTEVTLTVAGYVNINVTVSGVLDVTGTATMSITLPSGLSLLSAHVSQNVTNIAMLPTFQNEKITVARLETNPGAKSVLRFYTASGKLVPDGLIKNPWEHVDFGKLDS